MRLFKAFLADTKGATAVEYGLLAAVISVALASGMGLFSGSLQDVFNTVNNSMSGQ